MSRYRSAQLRTYGGTALLLLCGLAMLFIAGWHFFDPGERAMIAVTVLFGMAYCAAAIKVFHIGRRELAGDHWRAEDFA